MNLSKEMIRYTKTETERDSGGFDLICTHKNCRVQNISLMGGAYTTPLVIERFGDADLSEVLAALVEHHKKAKHPDLSVVDNGHAG